MAEKILQTRLLMKVDTLENWGKSTLKLKKGELAFATVAADAGVGLAEPVVMVKIGTDEEKTFSELPWAFHAKAADVLEAAKDADKLTAFINTVITNAKLATAADLTALTGRVATAEGEIDALQAALDTAETGLKARMTAAEDAIDALGELMGEEGSVQEQITAAIEALKIAEYAKKTEVEAVQTALDTYKTSNDKAVADNKAAIETEAAAARAAEKTLTDAVAAIKDGTTIDSFADVETALAGKDAKGAAEQALTDAKAYADGLAGNYDAKGSAAQALVDAKAYADGLAGNYDEEGAADQALVDAKAYVDAQIDAWVGETETVSEQITAAIAAEKLAETYAPIVHKHVKADITDFAHTHEMGEVNGLVDALAGKQAVGDYATKAEAQGYADAKDEAIAAALKAGQDAQGEVDALETYVGTIPTDEKYADITSVIGYVNKKAEETLAAASGNSTETAASVKAALDTYKTENDKAVKANADAIDALETVIGDVESVSEYVDAAVAAEAEIARAAEKANADAIKAIKDDYLVEADKEELVAAIATAKQEAIATVLGEGVDEDFDTLKEVADWILSDTTGAAALQTDVATIKADYLKAADKTELQGNIDGVAGRMTTAEGKITALEEASATHAAAADLTALAGRVTTAEGKITTLEGEMDEAQADILALEGLMGEGGSVQDQINAAIEALKIGDYAKAADLTAAVARIAQNETDIEALEGRMDTAEGKITTLETEVAKKANDAELAAIAKTGNVNDLVQTEGDVLIFDCGGAGVTA